MRIFRTRFRRRPDAARSYDRARRRLGHVDTTQILEWGDTEGTAYMRALTGFRSTGEDGQITEMIRAGVVLAAIADELQDRHTNRTRQWRMT